MIATCFLIGFAVALIGTALRLLKKLSNKVISVDIYVESETNAQNSLYKVVWFGDKNTLCETDAMEREYADEFAERLADEGINCFVSEA